MRPKSARAKRLATLGARLPPLRTAHMTVCVDAFIRNRDGHIVLPERPGGGSQLWRSRRFTSTRRMRCSCPRAAGLPSRLSRGDGAHVAPLHQQQGAQKDWNDPEVLILDFAGVRIASVSFFDEALGLTAPKHDLGILMLHVKVENVDPADRTLLNRIVLARARERGFGGEEDADVR